MRLASRLSRLEESATLAVSRRATELRESGVEVVDFGAGEPDFASPEVAVEAAKRALDDGFTKYTVVAGIPELRAGVAARYRHEHGTSWESEDVLITVGGKAALFELALVLLEGGDEAIVPSPCWVSFPEQIELAGAAFVPVPTDPSDGFRIHAEPIVEAITDRTRVVIVNSPSNPTGGVIEDDDLERVVEAAAERDVVVVSDETYDHFVYDGRRHVSAASLAADYPATVVVVGSFSKTYAMTGWRIGYAVGPRELVDALALVQGHVTSNPTSFAMKGAVAALDAADSYVEEMLAEYQARRDLLIPRLDELEGVECEPPAGAFYAFPDVSGCFGDRISSSIDLASYLLDEAAVAVVPGVAFGADDHVRISFACSRERLTEGLDRMEEALERLSR